MRRLNEERGFTIVEMMFAVVVLLVGALGTLAMLDTANRHSRTAGDRQNATALARQVLETAKSIPYRDVAPGTLVATLREDDALAGVSDSPWRIERNNATFTLQVEVCWLDEPADGLGSRAPGHFCPGSGGGGTADGNSIDHKRVTVAVSWNNRSGAGTARQSTLISARGGIDAPGVSSVELTSPVESPITDPAVVSASFKVTTNQDAAAVVWSLDGTQQDTTLGSAREWTFSWELPDIDGVYDVSAQAFDRVGAGGEVRSATVVVNRYAPAAPEHMVAARNGEVVEASWGAGPERDIIGYRVYRQLAGGAAEVACEFVTETACTDATPPPRTNRVLDYWAGALARAPPRPSRAGDPSGRVDVNAPNAPPNPPVDLVAAKDELGNTVLTWSPAPVPDPDGDPIVAYVVYRNGTGIAQRYAEVPATQTTFLDVKPLGVVDQYRVVAVDDRSTQSSFAGPVAG
jgi:prepilin-type N-terminal cleavage/methylation domain-containing protein